MASFSFAVLGIRNICNSAAIQFGLSLIAVLPFLVGAGFTEREQVWQVRFDEPQRVDCHQLIYEIPLILCKIQQWSQILRTLAHKGECEDWGFIQFSCGASFMLKFLQRVVQYTNRQTLAGH